ncbi:MAG: UbiD family decarboxylase [Desulfurococcales archaeon]|nr:UbiD family decarboxylase [Desulfurococcales archaeon]
MGYSSLKGFIEETGFLDYRSKILKREYEAALLLKKTQGKDKPVLFRVEDTEVDAVGNVVDTRERLRMALGVENDEEAYVKLMESLNPNRSKIIGFEDDRYREFEEGLLSLPAIKFYERDGGLYFTSSIVAACVNGLCNASIHRIMVVGEKEARIRIVPRHLWKLYSERKARNEPLPVTIVMGVHPAYMIASATSPPLGVFELDIGSHILGGEELMESPINKTPIPRGASIIIEARLMPEMADEGPFTDILLLYDKVRKQPVLKIDKIYVSREWPLAHVILSGGLEHLQLMGFPREAQIWQAVSKVVPKVKSIRLTPGGGGWLHAVISIAKNHPGDGKNAILAAFAGHPSLKHVVVVDTDIDVIDSEMVEWAIATRFQADRDLVIIREVRGSTLDPSGRDGYTAKMGIDATIKGDNKEKYERARIPGE